MGLLSNCTEAEVTAFQAIVKGDLADNHDPEVVRGLIEKNLLDDHSGYIMPSLYITQLWAKEQAGATTD